MKNIIEPSQNVDYDDVFETIQNDAQKRGLSDDKVWEIWQAGLVAQQSVQRTACQHKRTRVGTHGIEVCADCDAVL